MKNYSLIAVLVILLLGHASFARAAGSCADLSKAMTVAKWGVHVNDWSMDDRACKSCDGQYPNGMPGASIPGPPSVTGLCCSYDCSSYVGWIVRQIEGQTGFPPAPTGLPSTFAVWGSGGPKDDGSPNGWKPCDPTKQPVCVGLTQWGSGGGSGPDHMTVALCGKHYNAYCHGCSPDIDDNYMQLNGKDVPGQTKVGSGERMIEWLTVPGLESLSMDSCNASCTPSASGAPMGQGSAGPSNAAVPSTTPNSSASSSPASSATDMMSQMMPMMMMMQMMQMMNRPSGGGSGGGQSGGGQSGGGSSGGGSPDGGSSNNGSGFNGSGLSSNTGTSHGAGSGAGTGSGTGTSSNGAGNNSAGNNNTGNNSAGNNGSGSGSGNGSGNGTGTAANNGNGTGTSGNGWANHGNGAANNAGTAAESSPVMQLIDQLSSVLTSSVDQLTTALTSSASSSNSITAPNGSPLPSYVLQELEHLQEQQQLAAQAAASAGSGGPSSAVVSQTDEATLATTNNQPAATFVDPGQDWHQGQSDGQHRGDRRLSCSYFKGSNAAGCD